MRYNSRKQQLRYNSRKQQYPYSRKATQLSAQKQIHIAGRTPNQVDFLDAIEHNTITFGLGPAGTGKTYLSVASAVKAYRTKAVERIILTRPVVEAGEHLGFLPGDIQDKLDPYMRPLYDAFKAWMTPEEMYDLIDLGIIEIAPLAFLRGRTLNKAFIILDEAQNTTAAQMLMALTRLGSGSRMVVNGDLTQMDIPGGRTKSGLFVAEAILGNDLANIEFVHLSKSDVVRHPVVKIIVDVWEQRTPKEPEEYEFVPAYALTNGNGSQ